MPNLDPKTIVAVKDCPDCGNPHFEWKVTTRLNKLMATCVDRRCSAQQKMSLQRSQTLMQQYIDNDRQPIDLRKPVHAPQKDTAPKPAPGPTREPEPATGNGAGSDGDIYGDLYGD